MAEKAEETKKEQPYLEKLAALKLNVEEARAKLQEVLLRPDPLVKDAQAAREKLGIAITAHDDFVRSLQKPPTEGHIRCARCKKWFDPKPVESKQPVLSKDKAGNVSGIEMKTVYDRTKGRPVHQFGGMIGCPHCGFPVEHSQKATEQAKAK